MDNTQRFIQIMNDAIAEAERLPGTLDDFYRGLCEMQNVLEERIEIGKGECPEAFE